MKFETYDGAAHPATLYDCRSPATAYDHDAKNMSGLQAYTDVQPTVKHMVLVSGTKLDRVQDVVGEGQNARYPPELGGIPP